MIYISNEKSDKEKMIPGSITIMISKNGVTETIYHQTFGAFFLSNFKDVYPDEKSLGRAITESEIRIEEKLKERSGAGK